MIIMIIIIIIVVVSIIHQHGLKRGKVITFVLFALPHTLEYTLWIGDTIYDILAQQDHNLAPPRLHHNSPWTLFEPPQWQ